jgi:hypothetical protein
MSGAWEGALVCSRPGSGGAHPPCCLRRGALPRPQSCCLRRGEVWGGGLANAEGQLPGASKGSRRRRERRGQRAAVRRRERKELLSSSLHRRYQQFWWQRSWGACGEGKGRRSWEEGEETSPLRGASFKTLPDSSWVTPLGGQSLQLGAWRWGRGQ